MTTGNQILPIGLDLGRDSIKLMQLAVVHGDGARPRLSVVAAARQASPALDDLATPGLPNSDAWVDRVRQLLQSHPFSGRKVVAALPREMVQIKNLRLPPIPASELSAAVEFEAAHAFAGEKDLHIQYLPAGEVRQGSELRQEVVVLAARNCDVDRYIDLLEQAGLSVESLDLEWCALYRAIERFICRREDEQEVQVLVDIGFRRTQVIIGRGREINFFKPVEMGARNLHEALSRKLGISLTEARALRQRISDSAEEAGPEASVAPDQRDTDPVRLAVFDSTRSLIEDLARELAMYMRYHSVTFRGHRPLRVRLLGGQAADPQIQSVLASVLGLPVEAVRPLAAVDLTALRPSERRGAMSEWSLAMGLSLKRATEHFAPRDGRPRVRTAPPLTSASVAEPVQADPIPAGRVSDLEVVHA